MDRTAASAMSPQEAKYWADLEGDYWADMEARYLEDLEAGSKAAGNQTEAEPESVSREAGSPGTVERGNKDDR